MRKSFVYLVNIVVGRSRALRSDNAERVNPIPDHVDEFIRNSCTILWKELQRNLEIVLLCEYVNINSHR